MTMKSAFKFGKVTTITELIDLDENKVQFQSIFETGHGGVVLLAFKKGQKLDRNLAPAELMVNVLEGEIEFIMNDSLNMLKQGDFILVGADVPHSVQALKDSKVILVKIKPD